MRSARRRLWTGSSVASVLASEAPCSTRCSVLTSRRRYLWGVRVDCLCTAAPLGGSDPGMAPGRRMACVGGGVMDCYAASAAPVRMSTCSYIRAWVPHPRADRRLFRVEARLYLTELPCDRPACLTGPRALETARAEGRLRGDSGSERDHCSRCGDGGCGTGEWGLVYGNRLSRHRHSS